MQTSAVPRVPQDEPPVTAPQQNRTVRVAAVLRSRPLRVKWVMSYRSGLSVAALAVFAAASLAACSSGSTSAPGSPPASASAPASSLPASAPPPATASPAGDPSSAASAKACAELDAWQKKHGISAAPPQEVFNDLTSTPQPLSADFSAWYFAVETNLPDAQTDLLKVWTDCIKVEVDASVAHG